MPPVTPAIEAMDRVELMPSAYRHADLVLQSEGVDPTLAFVDTEIQRHHYAVGSAFQANIDRLFTLANLAFSDRLESFRGFSLLGKCNDATEVEKTIARDFDEKHKDSHRHISRAMVANYLTGLYEFTVLAGEK